MQEPALTLADLRHAFEELLTRLPTKALEPFARRKQLLGGGYRPGNAKLLCALVANALGPRLLTYDAELAALLRTHDPVSRLLAMLSREVLEGRAVQLMAFFGKAPFLLGLLMDPREDVRAKVEPRLASTAAELPTAETARDLLAQAFSPIVELGAIAPASAAGRETIAELRKQIEETEKKARRDRRELEEKHLAEGREVKSRIATMQFNIDERQKKIDALEAELERTRATLEARARALASARRIESLRPWLEPVQAVEAKLAEPGSDDLLARTRKALNQQALLDRASARRAELQSRLEALELALGDATRALAAALNPAPDLVACRAELEAACRDLRATLQLPEPESPLERELQARIDALTPKTVSDTANLLTLAERLNLLPSGTAGELRTRLRQRANAPTLAGELQDKDAPTGPNAIEQRNPLLAAALQGRQPLLLFLDAHNILNGLSRYKQRRGTAVTHEDARKALEHDIARLLANLPLLHAHLVWDGGTRSDFTRAQNLTVHYSGGEGDHRADRYILDQLSFFRENAPDLPRLLVSDDNDFCAEARRLGATTCRLHDFDAFLPF